MKSKSKWNKYLENKKLRDQEFIKQIYDEILMNKFENGYEFLIENNQLFTPFSLTKELKHWFFDNLLNFIPIFKEKGEEDETEEDLSMNAYEYEEYLKFLDNFVYPFSTVEEAIPKIDLNRNEFNQI
jgi:hypothetical protein